MIGNHQDFTPEFKARAVLQVLQDAGSAARICRELQIDESLLSDWKERFIGHASSVFEIGIADAAANERIAELERLVGRLMLELEESKGASAILSAAAHRNGMP